MPFLSLVLTVCGSLVFGQIPQLPRTGGLEGLLEDKEKLPTTVTQPSGVALESVVDPEKYYVGPSDVIAVNIWMSPSINLTLTVTPEGTLTVPTVGDIMVADMTLAKAKEKIYGEARKKYVSANITVTLARPRPIIVSVTGNVLNPGLYTLSSIDRVNKALDEANKPTAFQQSARGTGTPSEITIPPEVSIPKEMSTRNVVLKHKDGSQGRVDIVKFLATKEDKWNPYLREGDVIIVPKKNLTKNVFGIYGEVNLPGRYEFVDGDSLQDAIRIAYGFTRLAMKDSVEFSRLSNDGNILTTEIINLRGVLDGEVPNIPLQPGDRVVVKARLDRREDYRVEIEGEVLYPGIYPITRNQTRLSDVIRQAGGFTEFAFLRTAQVVRRSVLPEDIAEEQLLSLRGGVSPEDSAYYKVETMLRIKKTIANVDFEKLFMEKDTTQDILLQTEDKITIPSVHRTVYVFGQVVSPGLIPFAKGESDKNYIAKAGGFTEHARTGDVKIIKARTKQWLAPDETTIEEGDYIWVPKEPERSFAYYMGVASQTASVVSVIISVIVGIIVLTTR